jgi:hypothetical protein
MKAAVYDEWDERLLGLKFIYACLTRLAARMACLTLEHCPEGGRLGLRSPDFLSPTLQPKHGLGYNPAKSTRNP